MAGSPVCAGLPVDVLAPALRLNESPLIDEFIRCDDADVAAFGEDVRKVVQWALAVHRAVLNDTTRDVSPETPARRLTR